MPNGVKVTRKEEISVDKSDDSNCHEVETETDNSTNEDDIARKRPKCKHPKSKRPKSTHTNSTRKHPRTNDADEEEYDSDDDKLNWKNDNPVPKLVGPIDVSDVPDQPRIKKNEDPYLDNSRTKKGKMSSKYMGVYWDVRHNGWKAQVMLGGKNRSLGHFKTEKEAASVYSKACYKYKRHLAKEKLTGIYGGLNLNDIPEQPLIPKDGVVDNSDPNKSRFKGITKCKTKWQPRITIEGKLRYLGSFKTQEEAASIYAKAQFLLERRKKVMLCGEKQSLESEKEAAYMYSK
eukprot:CAMPEP_0198288602 /NCGR_PEP_ID=MMETSP1449-20131203/7047_1 /TAXON_ID=420275 /ORGANISM="Attheya septentrionalis, Strain CCMP2084" /LENGTH=289 /DNA_ID=CAMNT_0043986769 /DNA_START=10 /DNA_END=876 /DNA_ORIENTATION=-